MSSTAAVCVGRLRSAESGVRPVVCIVGPVDVRLPGPLEVDRITSGTTQLAAIALSAGEDALTLVDDRPVRVADLWRAIFAELFGGGDVTEVEVVHPSYWPAHRVDVVVAAARAVVPAVSAVPRSQKAGRSTILVEIGPHHVAVGGPGMPLALEDRECGLHDLLDRVCGRVPAGTVTISVDAPAEVAGASGLAASLVARLRAAGRRVDRLDDRALVAQPPMIGTAPAPPARRSARRLRVAGVAGAAGLVLAAVVTVALIGRPHRVPTTIVVEGAVGIVVPKDWTAQRITGGPGSARLEVHGPGEEELGLHLTQSRGGDLGAAARDLAAAVAAQAPGVFVDFNPDGRRAGRPAVTYTELRPGREIRWVVVVDGDTRISLGCQSRPGQEALIDRICDDAVRTAHAVR